MNRSADTAPEVDFRGRAEGLRGFRALAGQIGAYGSTQVLIQAIGFVTGILIIRNLSIEDYALYTIALTMLGTMNILSNGGIIGGAMSEGGKVWRNPRRLGMVIRTAEQLRRKFALAGLLVSIPILIYLLREHGASWGTIAFISVSVTLMFYTSLTDGILEIAPQLHQFVIPLSVIRCKQAVGRFVIVAAVAFTMPIAGAVLLATVLPQWWGNRKLRVLSGNVVEDGNETDVETCGKIIALVRRVMPGAIFYCISGQITVWLISIFGNTQSIAEIGALGRLAQITTIIAAMFTGLLVPRFARLPADSRLLTKWAVCAVLGAAFCGAGISFAVLLLDSRLLMILGSSYSGLERELVLLVSGSGIGLVGGVVYALCAARGWVLTPWISIPLVLLSLSASIPLVDLTTLQGVIMLSLYSAIPPLILSVIYMLFRATKESN